MDGSIYREEYDSYSDSSQENYKQDTEEIITELKQKVRIQVTDFNQFQTEFSMKQYGTSVNVKDTDNNECAGITVKSDTVLYLENLYKCGQFSGSKVIRAVENFARKYGYEKIKLQDESRIDYKLRENIFSVSFPVLRILATGHTWYNKLGYRSIFYAQELAHNRKIINLPFRTLIKGIAKQVKYNKKKLEYLLGGLYHIFGDCLFDINIQVQTVFEEINNRLSANDLDDDYLEWVLKVLNFIEFEGDAVQTKIESKNEKNIVYLKSFPQIKDV